MNMLHIVSGYNPIIHIPFFSHYKYIREYKIINFNMTNIILIKITVIQYINSPKYLFSGITTSDKVIWRNITSNATKEQMGLALPV